MSDKYFYKMINDNTYLVDFYASVDVPVQDDKVCEVLDIKGHHAESVTEEEIIRETEDNLDE